MGGCTSRQTPAAVAPTPLELSDLEKETHKIIIEVVGLKRRIKGEMPFLLTMEFIREMNSVREKIAHILHRYRTEEPMLEHHWVTYFKDADVSLRKEIHIRFLDGRIRIMAEVIRDPVIMDMILTQKVVDDDASLSALF